MLNMLTLVFTCQLVGEALTRATALPLPGPVAGMVLLFLFLVFRGEVSDNLSRVSNALLSHLALLFVPAGVGVMLHFRLLGDDWLPIAMALIFSTIATILTTAWVMQLLVRRTKGEQNG